MPTTKKKPAAPRTPAAKKPTGLSAQAKKAVAERRSPATRTKSPTRRIAVKKEAAKQQKAAAEPTAERKAELRQAALDAVAAPGVLPGRAERMTAALAEAKALKAWTSGGEQGERPATANLDAINALHAAGAKARVVVQEPGQVDPPAGAAPAAVRPAKGGTWMVNGRVIERKRYSLGFMACEHTKGVDGDSFLPTARFREVLAALGVSDVDGSSWRVTLPNGRVVAYVAPGDEAKVAEWTEAKAA